MITKHRMGNVVEYRQKKNASEFIVHSPVQAGALLWYVNYFQSTICWSIFPALGKYGVLPNSDVASLRKS